MNTARMTENLQHALEDLKRLRDEARLQIHLAGREAREKWETLEPKVAETIETARAFRESTALVFDDLAAEMRELTASLRRAIKEGAGKQRKRGDGAGPHAGP